MSPELDRAAMRAAERAHDKARLLAAEAIDVDLGPAEAAWLSEHLDGCADCQSVAAEYRAMHDELRGLASPEPPRDLWARTSAALDAADRSGARRSGQSVGSRLGLHAFGRSFLGSAVAVAVTVAVAGLSLLSQGPFHVPGPGPAETGGLVLTTVVPSNGGQAPLAVVGGTSYWIAPENGVYRIRGGASDCTGTAASCAVTSDNGTVLGTIVSESAVSAVIGPNARQAAVWTGDKIVILPLTTSAPETVSIDLLTPQPTFTAGPSKSPSASTVPSSGATSSVKPASTGSVSPSSGATSSVKPASTGSASPSAPETANPATPRPTATTPATVAAQPTAILDGYKVVGRAPEFSADGLWVAFSAQPADLSAGSDVYVWRTGWQRAQAVTTSHADLFAGWFGLRILISEFATSGSVAEATPTAEPSGSPNASATATPPSKATPTVIATSYVYDPISAAVKRIDRPMLLPVVDPTGRYLVYWSGTVVFNSTTATWEPGQGDLYFDRWANLKLIPAQLGGAVSQPTPKPTATPSKATATGPRPSKSANPAAAAPDISASGEASLAAGDQVSAQPETSSLPELLPVASGPGTVRNWTIRWDSSGRYVAIWVADPPSADAGHVTLLAVDPNTRLLNTAQPLLSAPAQSNIAFDDTHLVYTSPTQGGDGKTYVVPLPEVPPAPPVTPQATALSDSSGSGQSPTSESTPIPTDRPGN